MKTNTCPECGSDVIRDNQEFICSMCGLVVDTVDDRQEKQVESFDKSSYDKEMITRVDKNLGSNIGSGYNRLSQKEKYLNLDVNDNRVEKEYYNKLKIYCSNLDLPYSVLRFSTKIYDDLMCEGFNMNKVEQRKNLLSAILLFSTRELKNIRTIEEILDVTEGQKNRVLSIYKDIMNCLDYYQLPPKPNNFIDKFCDILGLSSVNKGYVRDIIEKYEDMWSNKNPKGVVAGVIYYVTQMNGQKVNMSKIEEKTHISYWTIKKRFDELMDKLGKNYIGN